MKKAIVIIVSIILVVALVIGGIFLFKGDNENEQNIGATENDVIKNSTPKDEQKEEIKFYFAFQELDVNNFNSESKIEKVYDISGEKILYELPLSYNNLIKDTMPKFKHKSNMGSTLDEYRDTDSTKNQSPHGTIYWINKNGKISFETGFYENSSEKIEDAINDNEYYINIGGSYTFKDSLKIQNNELSDFQNIVNYLGNPSNIYYTIDVQSEVEEIIDYWLIYNYEDYSLAFNFNQESYKTEEEWLKSPMPELRYPKLEDCFIYGGNSFEKFISETGTIVTHFSYEDYKEYK